MVSVFMVNAHGNTGSRSELNLKMWNNSTFVVLLDNYDYGKNTFFKQHNLTPGVHSLKVLKIKKNPYGNGFMKKVMYNGSITIPGNAKVVATITPNRQMDVKVVRNRVRKQYKSNVCMHEYDGCCAYSANKYVMNPSAFNQLMNSLSNESFDSNKLDMVEMALNYNNLNTGQVVTLMKQFSFESYKLKLAKMAYEKTVDKQNYFLVNNEFTFSSSSTNLNHFINQHYS